MTGKEILIAYVLGTVLTVVLVRGVAAFFERRRGRFVNRAKMFYKRLSALEDKYEVWLEAGQKAPYDEDVHLMLSDWHDRGKTYIRLDMINSQEEA